MRAHRDRRKQAGFIQAQAVARQDVIAEAKVSAAKRGIALQDYIGVVLAQAVRAEATTT